MSFMRLQNSSNGDIVCPHCGNKMEVYSWNTEYGDPLPGDNNENCLHCGKQFSIYCEVNATYTVSK